MWKTSAGQRNACSSKPARALDGSLPTFSISALQNFPILPGAKLLAVERSASRREQTEGRLNRHARRDTPPFSAEIHFTFPLAVLFSNELVDALPVHRVILQGGAPKEIFVGFRDGRFVDHIAELSTCAITEYFATQGTFFTKATKAEAGLEACDWITEVGRRLERGYVLTIDYGHRAAELFDDHHMRGTLLAYQDHRATENYYASPGQQDLTAHVNFTALEVWGKRSGLRLPGSHRRRHFCWSSGRK